MSTASPLPIDRPATAAATVRNRLVAPIKATAFWTAIVVPLAYPLLLAGGLQTGELSLLALVLAVNVAALVLGRDHNVE